MSAIPRKLRQAALAARPLHAGRRFRLAGLALGVALAALAMTNAAAAGNWTTQNTLNPLGAQGSSLQGVSCPSNKACAAVGYFTSWSGAGLSLAEIWDGTNWSGFEPPNPVGAQGSTLQGVSCSSATACTAVGNYRGSGGNYLTLAERWNGATWTIQPTPNPSGAPYNSLQGVSCPSATACTAVGFYESSGGSYLTLAERWNGAAWTVQVTPNYAVLVNNLNAVSCSSPTACLAVGRTDGAGEQPLAERWNDQGWTLERPPAGPSNATSGQLDGVSCTSAAACTAVGAYTTSAGQFTLSELSTGSSTWTIQPTSNATGLNYDQLSAVSCTSATACTAVGLYQNSSSTYLALAESWDGAGWSVQPTPTSGGGVSSQLNGVSCSSGLACTAVGLSQPSSGPALTLGERYS
jgi:hypothetical protein